MTTATTPETKPERYPRTARGLEMLTAWGGKLDGKIPPHLCASMHFPLTKCGACGNTPPRGALSSAPDETYEIHWNTWYDRSWTTATPSTTSPEQRAAIAAANTRYLEAIKAQNAAGAAYIEAALRERRLGRGNLIDAVSGARLGADPSVVSRAEAAADATAAALSAAEAATALALRELSHVSSPAWRTPMVTIRERVRRMVFG